jgi:hypothetical protein
MTVTPPLDPGIDEQFMFYPTQAQFDPGSIWPRKLMLETGRDLDQQTAARLRPRSASAKFNFALQR